MFSEYFSRNISTQKHFLGSILLVLWNQRTKWRHSLPVTWHVDGLLQCIKPVAAAWKSHVCLAFAVLDILCRVHAAPSWRLAFTSIFSNDRPANGAPLDGDEGATNAVDTAEGEIIRTGIAEFPTQFVQSLPPSSPRGGVTGPWRPRS